VIVCEQCGERSPAGVQFCGACGAFLEWDGTKTSDQPREPLYSGPHGQGVPPRFAPPPQGPPQQQGVPVGPYTQPQPQPSVMKPTGPAAQPARIVPPPPGRRPRFNPGDLICGNCGVGNAPERKFCRQCGASLADAPVVKTPWWRRWFRPKDKPKSHEVGSRPRKGLRFGDAASRIPGLIGKVLLVVLLLGGVLYGVSSPFRSTVNTNVLSAKGWVERLFVTKYVPVRPNKVTATAERPDHAAGQVADNATNTFWSAPAGGVEPALVLTFDRPVDLRRAIIRVGVAKEFQSTHRPQKLHLVYSTGKTFDVTVEDTPEPRELKFDNGDGATSVEIHVVALHRSLNPAADVAISELELFARG
jgi:ribosomal protein L40E